MTTFFNTSTGESVSVNLHSLIGKSTKYLYIRKGFMHGKLFLSQKGHGGEGAGDICHIEINSCEVSEKLFLRIIAYSKLIADEVNS